MKVVKYTKYGSPEVLQIAKVNKPTPLENEILIKVHYSTVSQVDSIFRRGENFFARMASGITKPKVKILGYEFSGTIESMGKGVTQFKVGDEVFGATKDGIGTLAEYICLPENAPIVNKPENLSFEHAAAFPSGILTAIPFLRDGGKIKEGNKILIIGASGSIGTFAVQLAKYYGAEVTGVCSTKNIDLVKSIGADAVIDYTKEELSSINEKYDIIFDTVGKSSFSQSKAILKESGKFLTTFISFDILFKMLLTKKIIKNKTAEIIFTGMRSFEEKIADLNFTLQLIKENKVKSVVDKIYPLESISEAHAYVDKGHKKGNVVIKIN